MRTHKHLLFLKQTLFVVALLCTLPRTAQASAYETQLVELALKRRGLKPATARAQDKIAFIEMVRDEVFTPDDVWPDALNLFHATTKESVIKRELLFHEGGRFSRLKESARNLRSIGIFSIVAIVPVLNDANERGVLVYTRDLWSLRLEQSFQVTGGVVDRLALQLNERNLLGRAKSLAARFRLSPRVFSIGQRYLDRRVFDSDWQLFEQSDLFFSQDTFTPEGIEASARLGLPLFDLAPAWSFDAFIDVRVRPERQVQGSELLLFESSEGPIERQWFRSRFVTQWRAQKQFRNALFVHRLEAGIAATFDEAKVFDEVPQNVRAVFVREVLPRVRNDVAPFLGFHLFSSRFYETQNLDSFGQTEAVQLGPALRVLAGAGSSAFLSTTDFAFLRAAAQFKSVNAGFLSELSFETFARYQEGDIIDKRLLIQTRLASPFTPAGRLLWRASANFLRDDSQQRLVSLGGDSGLRGYKSQAFFVFGGNVVKSNLEYRSPAFDLWSLHAGGTLFYDSGAVFARDENAVLRHSIGVGVHFLIPQFNRTPFRLDLAMPLDDEGFRVLFSFGDIPVVLHGTQSSDFLVARPL